MKLLGAYRRANLRRRKTKASSQTRAKRATGARVLRSDEAEFEFSSDSWARPMLESWLWSTCAGRECQRREVETMEVKGPQTPGRSRLLITQRKKEEDRGAGGSGGGSIRGRQQRAKHTENTHLSDDVGGPAGAARHVVGDGPREQGGHCGSVELSQESTTAVEDKDGGTGDEGRDGEGERERERQVGAQAWEARNGGEAVGRRRCWAGRGVRAVTLACY